MKLLLTFLTGLSIFPLFSQNMVKGTIKNAENNESIPYVTKTIFAQK